MYRNDAAYFALASCNKTSRGARHTQLKSSQVKSSSLLMQRE